ncbi:uncharacterized protein [Musca autumnalis]|uniref:uncharacterized protein n=1 Tax=Musca autumnalis TaxID=221902 RepID=UPI003CF32964
MKLFIILFIVLGINGIVYTDQPDKDYYDLSDSTEHVIVVELLLKQLAELSKATSKIHTKIEDLTIRFNDVEKKYGDISQQLNLISTEFANAKVEALTKLEDHEQRIDTSSKKLAVFDGSIADIKQVLSTSANQVLTFKNDISKTLKDHNGALQKLENDIRQYKERQENQINNLWENGSLEKKSNWTVILRREDGSVNFNRNWLEYKHGFGNTNSEFFIGMEKLHNITSNGLPHEMVITLRTFDGNQTYAKYDNIVIGSEKDQYELKVLGVYSGDAGDSLRHHEGEKFTTIDRDNDNDAKRNCAEVYKGAWWYFQCNPSTQLFGPYEGHKLGLRLRWSLDKIHELQFVEVKIKK